ncbi:acetoacetate decarboxylase family protein [Pseudonocardia alni]|uniref:acetoacetate decarboxylase family protein n=1 Tax=Pseudonocardia alni TaxID=33907 RepID=UPI00280AD204|nr:acetoacetate decarboxylase family protein [Pseudonocardia alni]
MEPARTPTVLIMPTGFGAAGGPRQAPGCDDHRPGPTSYVRYVVGVLGRHDQVAALLPDGLALRGDPVVQFHFFHLRDIPWLAGRGYNIFSVLVPARHTAADGTVTDGLYQAVLWENLADSIVTGREQLGHPKLFARLPAPRESGGTTHLRASWDDFTFAEIEVDTGTTAGPEVLDDLATVTGAGIISHKYIPRTGSWETADADYLTLSPMPTASALRDPQPPPTATVGAGRVTFHVPTWQDMPTQFHIVATLAALEQVEPRGAVVLRGTTYLDFLDQRVLS